MEGLEPSKVKTSLDGAYVHLGVAVDAPVPMAQNRRVQLAEGPTLIVVR